MTLVVAEAAGKRAHGTLVRRASAPEVRTPGVVGRLFLPPGTAPAPGVVLFPGSEGGLDSQTSNASLLASHGCAALVAATFAGDGPPFDGLPQRLERVPLERFADAIRLLARHERIDPTRVSAMAISRGSRGCWRPPRASTTCHCDRSSPCRRRRQRGSGSERMVRSSGSPPGRWAAWTSPLCKPTIRRCSPTSHARRSAGVGGGLASVRLCCTYLGGTLRSSTMPK